MARPWYPWYPSDYARATAHLTFIEDAAYRRQLDHCYSTGKLSANAEILLRVCRAITDEEKAAVLKVAAEFFRQVDGFLVQDRVIEEITKSQYLSDIRSEAGRKGASTTNSKIPASGAAKASASGVANKPAIADTTTTTTTSSKPVPDGTGCRQPAADNANADIQKRESCPYQQIINAYHEHFPSGPQVSKLTDKRKRSIAARWNEVRKGEYRPAGQSPTPRDAGKALQFFQRYFAYCESQPWCTGREPMKDGKFFRATIDNLVGAEFMAKRSDAAHDAREAA